MTTNAGITGGYTVRYLTMKDMDHVTGPRVVEELNELYGILSPQGARVTFVGLCMSIRSPLTRHFVAMTQDGHIVGMGTLAATQLARGPRLSLEDVFVHPDHRCNGLGTELALAVIRAARACGMASLDLVAPSNPDSVCNPVSYRIYVRLGWRQIHGAQYLMRLNLRAVDLSDLGPTSKTPAS